MEPVSLDAIRDALRRLWRVAPPGHAHACQACADIGWADVGPRTVERCACGRVPGREQGR